MGERLINKRVALGVTTALLFSVAIISRTVVNNENPQSANTPASSGLKAPTVLDKFRSILIEVGDIITPELGGRNFPSAARFD